MSLEGSRAYRTSVVQWFDTDPPTTTSTSQTAGAIALEGRIKIDRFRVHALAFARNAAFILLAQRQLLASIGSRFTPDIGITAGATRWKPTALGLNLLFQARY